MLVPEHRKDKKADDPFKLKALALVKKYENLAKPEIGCIKSMKVQR